MTKIEWFDLLVELSAAERALKLTEIQATDADLAAQLTRLLAQDAAGNNQPDTLPTQLGEQLNLAIAQTVQARTQIGSYRLLGLLGQGGMGEVWRAERDVAGNTQPLALKILKLEDMSAEAHERFALEQRTLLKLVHPNIARLLDAGVASDGRPWIAMELVEGVPITEYCDQHQLSINARLSLFRQVIAAVQYAHDYFIVHRDIKPDNVLVDAAGTVKLLDFGIAKTLDRHAPHTLTQQRFFSLYATAPEQLLGSSVCVGTDVYALGGLLYELLSGAPLISRELKTPAQLQAFIVEKTPTLPSKIVDANAATNRSAAGIAKLSASLRGDLDRIVLHALRKLPSERYASAREFDEDIQAFLEHRPVKAAGQGKRYRATKFLRRHWLAASISGVALASLLALTVLLGLRGNQLQRANTVALEQQKSAAEESARAIATRTFLEDMIASPDPWRLESGSAETRNVRVVDALAAAAANLDKRLSENPGLRAEVATMLGRTLRRLGQLQASRQQLESAVQLLATSAQNSQPRLEAEIQLATTLADLGEFDAADKGLTQILAQIDQMKNGAKSLQLSADTVIDARRAAATAAMGVGDSVRAEKLARANLQIASALSEKSALSGAQASLADILGEQGKWDEARRLLNEAYTNEQLRLGRAHPRVIQLLSLVANLAFREGDYALAQTHYEQAANLAETALGLRHPETLGFKSHVLLAKAEGGSYDAAIIGYREQIPINALAIGADHPNLLTMRSNYANALRGAGQLDAAEAEIESVFRRRSAVLGETHPDTLAAINVLGVIVSERKDFAKAEVLFRQASELYLAANGPLHPETVMMQANYLSALRNLGRNDEAIAGFEELNIRAEQVFPAGHWLLAVVHGHLGLSLMEGKRFQDAEPWLKKSYSAARQQFGDKDARCITFRARLVELYKRWEKPVETATNSTPRP